MFNVVGLDIFFICNLVLFIEEVSNPTVIHVLFSYANCCLRKSFFMCFFAGFV